MSQVVGWPQSKRHASHTPGLKFLLAACARGSRHLLETPCKDNPPIRGRPVRRVWPRPAVRSSTGARVIEFESRRPKNSGDSKLPTSGSASLLKVKHCGIQFPYDLCVAPPTNRVAAHLWSSTCFLDWFFTIELFSVFPIQTYQFGNSYLCTKPWALSEPSISLGTFRPPCPYHF